MVDEVSDDEGRYVLRILAVILDFDELPPNRNTIAYLLDTHFSMKQTTELFLRVW